MNTSIGYFVTYLLEAYISYNYLRKKYTPKYENTNTISIFAITFLILFFISFIDSALLNTIFFLIVNFLLILILFYNKTISALFQAFLITAIMMLCEIGVVSIMSHFFPDFYAKRLQFQNLIILFVFSKSLYFFSMEILGRISRKATNKINIYKTPAYLILMPLVSIYVLFLFMIICSENTYNLKINVLISVGCILIFSINILMFVIDNTLQNNIQHNMELQLQLQQEHNLNKFSQLAIKNQESRNVLIHDIKKHLTTIYDLNKSGKVQEISRYIETLTNSVELKTTEHLATNPILNQILCRYMQQCFEMNIKFDVDIRCDVIDNMQSSDVVSLFCNLLDNCIESAVMMKNAFIYMSIIKKEQTPFTVISLQNSCLNTPLEENGHFKMSRKQDSVIHGFGHISIANVVDKYHGTSQYYFDEKNCVFHSIILLSNVYKQ